MNAQPVIIRESWKKVLEKEFSAPYFANLKTFIKQEKQNFEIYPPGKQIFAAFDRTCIENVKIVIIGQDPYHKKGQANGLCFSVSPGVAMPPSLKNIFKEMVDDLGVKMPTSGNLEPWADQGVLLLNATLTVRQGEAASHQNKGWEQFTDAVIKTVSDHKEGVVFLLWGRFAHSKEALIDKSKHYILKAAHPSPLARGAYFGSKHFSQSNAILKKIGKEPINWTLP